MDLAEGEGIRSIEIVKATAIYTVTPSWPVKKKKDFSQGVKKLEGLGFRVHNKAFIKRSPSVAGKVRQIHSAFADKRVDIVLAQRGGYSSMKVLPHLDFDLIRKNPKIFVGFSDLSTMLNVIYERAGLVTLHGPMVVNFSRPRRPTVRSFLNAVEGFPEKDLLAGAPVHVYRRGNVRGILKGGNLETLTSLVGTEWEISTEGTIFFLEEVGEKLYRVDRLLTQWIMAGKFRRMKGLILGDFERLKNSDVYRIIASQMKIDFPVIHCPYIGHASNKITLPVGARVELNASRKSLIVL
ncbi:MAG TPA: LD-carboxypeptidase [Thermodesulfobacteriota bacterium]|nr:LD-carboxypeptidase [Thermodesulfobacteriota bacterium]